LPATAIFRGPLYAEAEAATAKVKALADCLIALELRGLGGEAYEEQRTVTADYADVAMRKTLPEFQAYARDKMRGRRPFHWPVEFPEVFVRGGFDAFVGNPPFLGGTRISYRLGDEYLNGLYALYPFFGNRADLVSIFFCRSASLISDRGYFGLIGTDTIAEGDTREVGLERMLATGGSIYRAVRSTLWPGTASQRISIVHFSRRPWSGSCVLDEQHASRISAFLDESASDKSPYPLKANRNCPGANW
jgi:hypothetical protein